MLSVISVKVTEAFSVYNHDYTIKLAEVSEGEIVVAELYEETEEYFGKDTEGRELHVGELNVDGTLELQEGFELLGAE